MPEGITIDVNALINLRRHALANTLSLKTKAQHNGVYTSHWHGRGMDFAETRHYQIGDDSRHMEWRVTARTGRPHVKLFHEERERPVILLVDFSPSMYFGTHIAFKSVIAAQLAALIAWTGAIQGDRVGGLLYSATSHHEFLPRSRQAGVLTLLKQLALYTQQYAQHTNIGKITLTTALSKLQKVIKPGSILTLISDLYTLDNDSELLLRRLRQHNDIIIYWVNDQLELAPPPPNYYAITNGIQSQMLDMTDTNTYNTYQQYCDTRRQEIHNYCNRLQITCIDVQNNDNLAKLVRQTFPRRKI